MKLSNEKQQIVLKNQKLVHFVVRKLGVFPNSSEYDDLVSIGNLGLVKAALTFDESKAAFSTYASKCIKNEIIMHFRNIKNSAKEISLDEPIGEDSNGNELTLADVIQSSDSDVVDKIVITSTFIKLISIVLNYLNSKERIVMLYRIGNITQADIAKILNISRSYISRVEAKAISKIREVVNNKIHYEEVFFMAVTENSYRISFASKDISCFNKIFANLLKELTSAALLPDFKVTCNKERVIIQVPAHPESFSFIGKIIQEIDTFSMTYVSGDYTLPTENTVSGKVVSGKNQISNPIEGTETGTSEELPEEVESDVFEEAPDETDEVEFGDIEEVPDETEEVESSDIEEVPDETEEVESGDIEEVPDETDEVESGDIEKVPDETDEVESGDIEEVPDETDEVESGDIEEVPDETAEAKSGTPKKAKNSTSKPTKKNKSSPSTSSNSESEKGTYVTQVRDYMLTLDTFTVNELREHFPNLPSKAITNAIYLAKGKKLIDSTEIRGKYIVNKS